MRKVISILLVLVMALSLFTACDGADGKNGIDGANGKDGIAPQVKIGEDDYWYVSYDSGATWQSLNVKATGEDGAPGVKGDDGAKGDDGPRGETGAKGDKGEPTYIWVKYADAMPTSNEELKDTVSDYMGVYNGKSATAPTDYTAYQWIKIAAEPQLPEQADEDFTVLAIGNSFLKNDAAIAYVYELAEALGMKNIKVGNMYQGGVYISTTYNSLKGNKSNYTYYENDNGSWRSTENYSIRTALAERDWDYIIINQSISRSGDPSTFSDFLDYVSLIRYLCPGAKVMYSMSWTYAEGSVSENFADYNNDTQYMFEKIVSTTQAEVIPLGVEIIPGGTAVANARASGVPEEMITYDSFTAGTGHLAGSSGKYFGRYLVSLAVISKLTGLPIDDISFAPSQLSAEEKALAIACVKAAMSNPYVITDCSAQ